MENYTILIVAFLILIFIGLIHRKSSVIETKKEAFRADEPPHILRRLGLSPPNCPFRDQY